jgi:hypothetical protein
MGGLSIGDRVNVGISKSRAKSDKFMRTRRKLASHASSEDFDDV